MKIAFNQATTMKYSTLEKDLELCDKYGYDRIEIRLDQLKRYLTKNTIDDLRTFFQTHRIKPFAFNALEFINFRDPAGFRQIEEDLKFLCECGEIIDCQTIVVVPTFDIGDYSYRAIKEETVGVLHRLAERAQPYGAKLALEFCGYPNCSINTFAQAYEIVTEVNRDDVGLVLDCFHFYAMNSNLQDLAQADPNKIMVFHIDDCEDLPVGSLRDHHRLWPGEGVISLESILQTLKEIGYREMASIEVFRPEYWEWEIEAAIQTAKVTTEEVVGRVFQRV
ncbi:sugar phosphate isomerase/epimerase family protein [Desmospora activa]|uniref:2-keto-myo-inositol isomerase n=1 Tax=Desmospora activa DSM 45169 TaxID=1121389 RepID=A0A2T4Z7N6_9BACL|nr:sugar phosphate isomerase/epimerase [Desmospora activa]PTM57908.1 2-keto-myo-inositol isomerase [Desmospora activa DSM 45169]